MVVLVGIVVVAAPVVAVRSATIAVALGIKSIPHAMIHVYNFFNPSLIDARVASMEKKLSLFSAIRSKETVSNWHVTKAQYEMLQNQTGLAVQDLQKAIAVDANNFNALYYLGYLSLVQGSYKFAVKYLDEALAAQPKRPVDSGIKKQFHQVEQGMSSLKVNLLGAKDMLSNAITFGKVHQHVANVVDDNEQMRERIKHLETKDVSQAKMLNARAIANFMQGLYFKAIPDLQTLVQDASIKPSIARLRYVYTLASAHFYAQQWQEANVQLDALLQLKGLPTKYKNNLQIAAQYCQYKQGKAEAMAFPFYMRFLPDEMLQCVFSYFEPVIVERYLQTSMYFAPFMPNSSQ